MNPGWFLFFQALLAGFFAGAVVTLVTFAIEKFGGRVGGLLGTSPSTIIAAAVGFAIQGKEKVNLNQACFVVPIGISLDCIFLYLWRSIPKFSPIKNLSFWRKLAALTVLCLLSWLILATIVEILLQLLSLGDNRIVRVEVLGVCFFVVSTLFGVLLAIFQPIADSKAKKTVAAKTYFYRSLAAAVAIFASVLLASIDSSVGGIVSTFPAIFVTSMVSLTISHRSFELSNSSVGPMILGCQSVSAFAMLFALIFPWLLAKLNSLVGVTALSVLLSWFCAVVGVSLPAFLFLDKLRRRHSTVEDLAQQAMLSAIGDERFSDDASTSSEFDL